MQQHKTDISSIKKSSSLQFEQNSFILPLIYPTKSIAALRCANAVSPQTLLRANAISWNLSF